MTQEHPDADDTTADEQPAAPVAAPADPHPRLAGRRVTDLSALAGLLVWLGLAATADPSSTVEEVELFVALALLVLVPIGLGVAAPTGRAGPRNLGGLAYRLAVLGQLPGAIAASLAFRQPVGSTASIALVLPWLLVTGAIAGLGAARLFDRRAVRPLPELAMDAALLYVPVGAVALLLHRADVSLQFEPFIVLLTVVHYHYAGFALPLVTGRAGRIIAGEKEEKEEEQGGFADDLVGRVAALATLVIVVNLALIAVGITFSPTIEIVAVALFTLSVVVFSAVVLGRVVPVVDRGPAALLGLGALTMLWTMALAMAYAYSAFPATGQVITITEMVTWHGRLNALAFAIPGLLAFRWLDAT